MFPGRRANYIYQLKVMLRDIRPPVWRRFLVRGDTDLHHLHLVLQTVMGWHDCHLYEFFVEGRRYAHPEYVEHDPMYDPQTYDCRKVTLSQCLVVLKERMRYVYDFGDDWRHDVMLEDILPPGSRDCPVCIKGKRACPPEDCGGPWGYEDLLRILQDPADPEHEEMQIWVGGSFDPEAFDLDFVNAHLREL